MRRSVSLCSVVGSFSVVAGCCMEERLRSSEQAVYVLLGIEDHKVVDFLANAHVTNRKIQFLRDRNGNSTLGSAIQFRQHDARDARYFQKLSRLLQSVLPGYRIQHEQRFVRRAFNFAARDTPHLFQFRHQIGFCV